MTATVLVVGASGSGKTTLIERVLPRLRARGLTVGTVKHAHHGYDADRPGSDSTRHADAGAAPVALVGPSDLVVRSAPLVPLATLVARHFRTADLVLVEGFTSEPGPKILVHRRGVEPRRLPDPKEVILAVTDEPLGYPREAPLDDTDQVAATLAQLAADDTTPAVELLVDGQVVPLSEFVRQFVAATVTGMISALKGIPDEPSEIELVVRRPS